MKKLLLLAFLLGSFFPLTHSQSLEAYKKSAENAYFNKDYPTAYVHASQVLKQEPENVLFLKIGAESAVEVCEFDQAERYFSLVQAYNQEEDYAIENFFMAKIRHRQGRYDEAADFYRMFIEVPGNATDPALIALAKIKLDEAVYYIDFFEQNPPENSNNFQIRMMGDLSTPGQSDFAMPWYNENIIVGKLTPPEQCECEKPCSDKMQLYQRSSAGNQEKLLLPKGFKDVGHITYANQGQRAYFTACTCKADEYTCEIYYADRLQGAGSEGWSKPIKVPGINHPGYTSTQPYYHPIEGTIGRLYYASNYHADATGRRDLDIYYTDIEGNSFQPSINIVDINTTGDEVTPFYHAKTYALYFSSNGRRTLGGYDFDVFKYVPDGTQPSDCPGQAVEETESLVNLGAAINSQYDDLYFSMDQEGTRMIFSSNRVAHNRAMGETADNMETVGEREMEMEEVNSNALAHCCPDIFEARPEEPKVDILLTVNCKVCNDINPETALNLDKLKLEGKDQQGNPLTFEKEMGVGGIIKFRASEIPLNQSFMVSAAMDDFHGDTTVISTGSCPGEIIERTLLLEPQIKLVLEFQGLQSRVFANEIGEIVLKGWIPDSSITLTNIGQTYIFPKKECSAGQYIFNIIQVPDSFQLIGEENQKMFEIKPTCEPQTIRYSFDLQKITFNPVPLYFDHAIPGPRNAITAPNDYSFYYEQYKGKESTFITQSARYGCAFNTESLITEFFNDVNSNLDLMNSYADQVRTYIEPVAEDNAMIEQLNKKIKALSQNDLQNYVSGRSIPASLAKNEIQKLIAGQLKPDINLNSLSDQEIQDIIMKEQVEVTIQGVASVSAKNSKTYSNSDLAKRRISSMDQYLKKRFMENHVDGLVNSSRGESGFDNLNVEELDAMKNLLLAVYTNLYRTVPDSQGDAISNEDAPSTGECRIWDVRASRDRRIQLTNIVYPKNEINRAVVIDIK
ncbi:MAG: hypothetical protein R2828_09220 [Saprospiraceae bacterium]